jgi:acylphosphatase
MLPERRRVLYSGYVQGVGFRYATEQVASGYDVSGYVRNLGDGRVEVVVEGRPAELDAFQHGVAQAMAGHISDTEVEVSSATGGFDGFRSRF